MSLRVAPAMRNHVSDMHVTSGTKRNVHAYIQDIAFRTLPYDICSATWYDAYLECEFFVDGYSIVARGDDLTFSPFSFIPHL